MVDPDKRRAALAEALREPLRAGALDAGLAAVRELALRDPGDTASKATLEALELLGSQVWLAAEEPDEALADAGWLLGKGKLGDALSIYESMLASSPSDRVDSLAYAVRVVVAAAGGLEIPGRGDGPESLDIELSLSGLNLDDFPSIGDDDDEPPTRVAEKGELPLDAFDDVTRTAEAGELPLNAFETDDVTRAAPVDAPIPPEAYPKEPTLQVELGDYDLFNATGDPESTRVAKPGELPIEELRKQIAEEEASSEEASSMEVDLDALEPDPEPSSAAAPAGFEPPPAPAPAPESVAPAAPPSGPAVPPAPVPPAPAPSGPAVPAAPVPPAPAPAPPEPSGPAVPAAPVPPAPAPAAPEPSGPAVPAAPVPPAPAPEPAPPESSSPAVPAAPAPPAPAPEPAPESSGPAVPAAPVPPAPAPPAPSPEPTPPESSAPAVPAAPVPPAPAPSPEPVAAGPEPPEAPAPPAAPEPPEAPAPPTAPEPPEAPAGDSRGPSVPRAPVFARTTTPSPAPTPADTTPPQAPDEPAGAPRVSRAAPAPADYRPPPAPPPAAAAPAPTPTPAPAPAPAPTPTPAPAPTPAPTPTPAPAPTPAPTPAGSSAAAAPTGYQPPPAPAPSAETLATDPVHAPIDTQDITLASDASWADEEEGDETGVLVQTPGDRSWPGIHAEPEEPTAPFEPSVESMSADQWADEVPPAQAPDPTEDAIARAEEHFERGELGAALGIYQDLAVRYPDDPRLWKRVEEIAKRLQRQSDPPG